MNDINTFLKMTSIQKFFGEAEVLKKVELEVQKGELHALLGENGAGKSTLIKILTGIYPKDGGSIYIEGRECTIESRTDAAKLGIGVVYQELSVIPTLSVYNNVLLGNEVHYAGILNIRKMKRKVNELIKYYGFELNPNALVESLSIAQRQCVEILKALSRDTRLIVMDEPTASLSEKESMTLFSIINQLKEKGVSILYISHRLEEVFQLADRISILRDGKNVAVILKKDINPSNIITMMIGKELNESSSSRNLRCSENESILEIENLCSSGKFNNISFNLHKGEILGIGGLVGSGRTEIIRCIFGADNYDSGTIKYKGENLPKNIKKVIQKGFGLIPEDRRNQGFVPLLSIVRNISIPSYKNISRAHIVDRVREFTIGKESVKNLDIRPADPEHFVGNLSGGNQQKVVLGKWLARDFEILLVDEPTAGIDIGARSEIYKILEEMAENGVSVIVVSSDLMELLRISHRIIVMRKGSIFREFNSGVVTQEDILKAASGIPEKNVVQED